MGDIISILRHSKIVSEKVAQDKLFFESAPMKEEKVSNPTPLVSSSEGEFEKFCKKILQPAPLVAPVKVPVKVVRRAPPEHKSKSQIPAKESTKKVQESKSLKYSAMQSDKLEKKSIFDRLASKDEADSTSNVSLVNVSKVSSSIFNRLGQYVELRKKIENNSMAFSGILKNSPTQRVSTLRL